MEAAGKRNNYGFVKVELVRLKSVDGKNKETRARDIKITCEWEISIQSDEQDVVFCT